MLKNQLNIFKLFIFCYLISINSLCFSQGAAINKTGATAEASAILDVSSNNAGVLIPRMTKDDRNLILQPAEGLLIYQTNDTVGFWYYNNGWKQIASSSGSGLTTGTSAGNTLYWNGTSWIESSNIFNSGSSVGIGTNSPESTAKVEINSNNSGFLIPRLTTNERDAITNPAIGLQIFNTECETLEIYLNNGWHKLNMSSFKPANVMPNVSVADKTEITWNWLPSNGATGYMYNTVNNYNTAFDNGNNTTFLQGGLDSETIYNLYVWAYNNCEHSEVCVLTDTTLIAFFCGVDSLIDNRDMQYYQTAQIGNQCWMKENLKYLPVVHNNNEFSNQGNNFLAGYGVYDYNGNDLATAKSHSNYDLYGVLYNWHAAMGGSSGSNSNPSGVKGICPDGWHLPSQAEWEQLINYLSSNSQYWCSGVSTQISKALAATTSWSYDSGNCAPGNNQSTNNSSGFTGLAVGNRYEDGTFNYIGMYPNWWTTTTPSYNTAQRFGLDYNNSSIKQSDFAKSWGVAVRCIRDM